MKKVVLLTGPTATGKTLHSIQIAKAVDGEIVNFDSLLFYKELNIGSAKPTISERQGVPHHMIDVRSITEPMNASAYALEATPKINDILAHGRPVILVGGSGFYARALLRGMYNSPTTPKEINLKSDELYKAEGIAPFREILRQHDPDNFKRLHENDHYRIRRAVAHWWTNGTAFSVEREAFNPNGPEWEILPLHLDMPKEEHLPFIEKRTRSMIELGLIQEVEKLLALGFTGQEKPLQSIGYKETVEWIRGEFGTDLKAFEERININTRQLAKTQRTWFKKENKQVFDPRTEGHALLSAAKKFISQE